jgi:hypothetical protein
MSAAMRRAFIRSELEAAADHLEKQRIANVLAINPNRDVLAPRDAAAGLLVDRFLNALDGGLPFCEHAQPYGLTWALGMANVGCPIDLVAHTALATNDPHCDLCGDSSAWPRGGLVSAVTIAGPVAIYAFICRGCRAARSTWAHDRRELRGQVIDFIAARFNAIAEQVHAGGDVRRPDGGTRGPAGGPEAA